MTSRHHAWNATLALAIAAGTPLSATAIEPRWYLSATGGLSLLGDPAATLRANASASEGRLTLDRGTIVGGAIGWYATPALRLEGEIAYRTNRVQGANLAGLDASQSGADLASLLFMANVLKDFGGPDFGWVRLRPYVGVGVGFAQEVDTDIGAGEVTRQYSGDRAAYQMLGGVNWLYRSGWYAGAGLRWIDAGRVRLKGDTASTGTLDVDYKGLSAELRVGWRF